MRTMLSISMVLGALALSGCMRTDVGGIDTAPRPVPLEAQPIGTVESGALPDPTTDTTQFPEKPVVDPALSTQNTELAAANALDVKKETMVGGWKVSQNGASCDMFLTLTNLGSGSRGGTRGCAGELQTMASWEVQGKQILLKDRNGNVVGRLFKTAENRFDGTTNAGAQVGLSR